MKGGSANKGGSADKGEGADKGGQRSISVRGSVSGSVLNTGDGNRIALQFERSELPPANSVDIAKAIADLTSALGELKSDHQKKIDNALSEAEDEAGKESPDKAEVGKSLARALEYAQKAAGFASVVEKIKPALLNAAAWLGTHGDAFLRHLGL